MIVFSRWHSLQYCNTYSRTSKNLQKTKKLLKHRFWTEIYDGAKMFYFSGCINGKYLKNEVKQLSLFIQRAKVRNYFWMRKVWLAEDPGDEIQYLMTSLNM